MTSLIFCLSCRKVTLIHRRLYFDLINKIIKLTLDCPFWYFLSTGSELDLQLGSQRSTGNMWQRYQKKIYFGQWQLDYYCSSLLKQQIDMSLQSNTLSWLWDHKSLLLLINDVCSAEKWQIPNFIAFSFILLGFEQVIYRTSYISIDNVTILLLFNKTKNNNAANHCQ